MALPQDQPQDQPPAVDLEVEGWPKDYPTIDELEAWLQAAQAQWAAFEKQTPEERVAARRELENTLFAYEKAMEWPMASPDTIRQYLEHPLLGPGPADRPWRKHFLLTDAAYYWCRNDVGRFTLVCDMLKFLSGMVGNARLPIAHCMKAREVLQHLYNHNIPDPLTYRLLSTTREAEGWLLPVQTEYDRVHADMRQLWKKTPSNRDRAEALRRTYPDLSLEDCQRLANRKQHYVAKAIVGRRFGGRSPETIHQIVARASRLLADRTSRPKRASRSATEEPRDPEPGR